MTGTEGNFLPLLNQLQGFSYPDGIFVVVVRKGIKGLVCLVHSALAEMMQLTWQHLAPHNLHS